MSQTTAGAIRPRVLARPEGVLRRIMAIDEIGVIGALLAICIFLSLTSDKFLQTTNLINVTRQASWFGIMAVGMVFVISMGDIDLSVGSILMLSSVSMALLLKDGQSIWLAMAAGLAIGTACGFVNGTLSVLLRIPTIIVTLGTLSLFRGIGLVITHASPVSGYKYLFKNWFFTWVGGKDPIFSIWMSVWILLAVAIAGWVLFNHTAFGRRVQAVGSNRQAARFSGIRIARYRIMVMTLMGFIVGIAAITVLAFNRNGSPTVGEGDELKVIAATIIGGTALTGGSGSILGAVLGALIIAIIQNGLALLRVDPSWAVAVTGIVIIVAVTLDYVIKRR